MPCGNLSSPELSSQSPTPSYIATYFKLYTQIFHSQPFGKSLLQKKKKKHAHLLIRSILQQHRFESESKGACPLGRLGSFRMGGGL